jgi:hypothetical protein
MLLLTLFLLFILVAALRDNLLAARCLERLEHVPPLAAAEKGGRAALRSYGVSEQYLMTHSPCSGSD